MTAAQTTEPSEPRVTLLDVGAIRAFRETLEMALRFTGDDSRRDALQHVRFEPSADHPGDLIVTATDGHTLMHDRILSPFAEGAIPGPVYFRRDDRAVIPKVLRLAGRQARQPIDVRTDPSGRVVLIRGDHALELRADGCQYPDVARLLDVSRLEKPTTIVLTHEAAGRLAEDCERLAAIGEGAGALPGVQVETGDGEIFLSLDSKDMHSAEVERFCVSATARVEAAIQGPAKILYLNPAYLARLLRGAGGERWITVSDPGRDPVHVRGSDGTTHRLVMPMRK